MHTLLIGDMKQMEYLYYWLQLSDKTFEIDTIISENATDSELFFCEIKPISCLNTIDINYYDFIFICSNLMEQYKKIFTSLGADNNKIKTTQQVINYLPPKYRMEFYKTYIKNTFWSNHEKDRIIVGDFTYSNNLSIINFNEKSKAKVNIGKFCSIAENVTIFLNENHRHDWCTTYPFNVFMAEYSYIDGHPFDKGDVNIGNDVWIGSNVTIMSGISIGDGSVIAANACVTKDVSPYTIVGGVPAKKIKNRFSQEITEKLMEINWWSWSDELIYEAIPLLQSNSFHELFEFYENKVK